MAFMITGGTGIDSTQDFALSSVIVGGSGILATVVLATILLAAGITRRKRKASRAK